MREIIPSPGTENKTFEEVEKKLELVAPFARTIHIDVLDGKFADNKTFLDPTPFKKFSHQFFLEVHLMVEEPIVYLKPFADAGFKRFIGQIEKMSNQAEFVAQGQLLGEVGLAVDGPTSLENLQVPIQDLDCVLIMTITAGFSGQKFVSSHLQKVREVRNQAIRHSLGDEFPIEVDGGINDSTIQEAKMAGANRFVATSFLFNGDPFVQYQLLEKSVATASV